MFFVQKHSSGSIAIKIEPGYQETAGITEQFVRAHFDYNPRQDRLIPSQDAGMPFRRGDIIKVLNQEDNFWWQVCLWGCGQWGCDQWVASSSRMIIEGVGLLCRHVTGCV